MFSATKFWNNRELRHLVSTIMEMKIDLGIKKSKIPSPAQKMWGAGGKEN